MAPKNKKGDESEGGGKDVSRAVWSKETLYLFCDLCIETAEKSKGKSGATISQRMQWNVLEVAFNKRTNLEYDKKKLKNKWDWMKARWSLWKSLKGKETGLGWDHKKGTISASEEWWKKKIEENVNFKSFKDEGVEPELEQKMEQLFGVSVAQGTLRFTPVQSENENVYIPSAAQGVGDAPYDCDDEMSENDAFNHNQAKADWQELFNDDSPAPSPTPSPTEHGVKRRGTKRVCENDGLESSKSSKTNSTRKGGAAMLVEKLETMVKIVTERNIKDMELMKMEASTLGDSSNTLSDSLAKLVSMPDLIPGDPEFSFACTLIEDPQKRIILNGMPNDYSRLQYIKYLYAKNEKTE